MEWSGAVDAAVAEAGEAMSDTYPVAILEDRYSGSWSGGKWIAVACADNYAPGESLDALRTRSREEFVWGGSHDETVRTMSFWEEARGITWIAVGDTPDEGVDALRSEGHVYEPPS